jgi:transcriptional regulator with XRE-family HTH domain
MRLRIDEIDDRARWGPASMTSEVMGSRRSPVYAAEMSTMTADGSVGTLLRGWRERRRLSQLELASIADVSTRHLSFVETGKSRPTPAMIVRLAEHLEVPLRDRNALLLAGGYAPQYPARSIDDASLGAVMAGFRRLLDAHLPNPALLLDNHWDIVDANPAVDLLLAGCDPKLLEPPVNALRVSLHPDGVSRRIRNLGQWAAHLHHQVTQRAEHTGEPVLAALAAEIADYGMSLDGGPTADPVLVLELETDEGAVVRFFSVVARLETAADVTLDELHLETFLPADAPTQAWLEARSTTD